MRHKQFQDHTATSNNSSIVKYQAPNGAVIDARIADGQVWLTYEQVASLFDVLVQAIRKHSSNIIADGELPAATSSKLELVQTEGNRSVNRDVLHLNQEMVLHIGYRVRSERGSEFRRWATDILLGRTQSPAAVVSQPTLSRMEMIAEMASAMARQERETARLRDEMDQVAAKVLPDPDYRTVMGHANIVNVNVTATDASVIGRAASKLAKAAGREVRKTVDERWGSVNLYHRLDLERAFLDFSERRAAARRKATA